MVDIGGTSGRHEGALLFLARMLIAILFLGACIGKLTDPLTFASNLSAKGLPAAMPLAVIAGLTELIGGLGIALGFKTRWAAALLFLFTIVATLIGHSFWTAADEAVRSDQQIHFMKNLAIMGGLIYVYVFGAGPWSIDRR